MFARLWETAKNTIENGAQVERVREPFHGPVSDDEIRSKAQAGWKPVAVIWE